ncbi:MAG: amidohydrolase family protein [Phycisphaerales bacterium]|nr:amidohydrolase family protein [Phycisphaerales bacterium]
MIARLLVCTIAIGLAAGSPALANGDSFAIRAKAVYPCTPDQPGAIEGGIIIVRDGRIVAVGADLPIPPDLPVLDLTDEIVCPGLVSAGSALVGPHAGPDAVSGAYRAADSFNVYGRYDWALSTGVTTAHLSPGGHRLVSGQGAIVKLAGAPQARVISPESDLSINLGVFGPPRLLEPPFYASSDVAIDPAKAQRPSSRMGQLLELETRVAAIAENGKPQPAPPGPLTNTRVKYPFHALAFDAAWQANLPLRVQAREAADIESAIAFIEKYKRKGYLVGLSEGQRLADEIARAGLLVVLRLENAYRGADTPIGANPEAIERLLGVAGALDRAFAKNKGGKIALAGAENDAGSDLRLVAGLAQRGGMSEARALAAVTRVPAEILGIDGRVGSLAPGKDADLIVLSGPPLAIESQVLHVFVDGRKAWTAPRLRDGSRDRAVVIKGGTIWLGTGSVIRDGAVLVEDGKVRAVGQRVPRPYYARVIDAGPDAYITPGFIDSHGHLGLEEINLPNERRTVATPDVPIDRVVGAVGADFARVARAGVTTVMLAAYRTAQNGSRIAAVKTFGRDRGDMVTRDVAGVKFSLAGTDALMTIKGIQGALEAGKRYEEAWKKYADDLEKWKMEREKGATPTTRPAEVAETAVEKKPDPITGTWDFEIKGGPMPQPLKGSMILKLTGNQIEGRAKTPGGGNDTRLTGTFDGKAVTLELDQETDVGKPTISATIDRDEHMTGQFKLGDVFQLDFEASRVEKGDVEFRVERTKKTGKDGRPAPPKVDDRLEPLRPLLAGKIPAVVEVRTNVEAREAMKLFVDQYKIPLILLDAPNVADLGSELEKRREQVGVIVPPEIVRSRDVRSIAPPFEESMKNLPVRPDLTIRNTAAELARLGVRVGLQSDAEDGARSLPLVGLFAVQQGLGGDEALRALTVDAAKMFRIDDRVGTLEPGKDGDVLIFSGHPFDAASRLERVIVGGREVGDAE